MTCTLLFVSLAELRVHIGGSRRENSVQRRGTIQIVIFLWHLLLGLGQPTTVSVGGPSRAAGISFPSLH